LFLPLVLTATAVLLDRNWGRLPVRGWKRALEGDRALIALLAVAPFALLAVLSQFRPLLNQRGLLFAAPYWLLLIAAGLVALRPKWRVLILPFILLVFGLSLVSFRQMTVDPADYAGFASAVRSEIQSGDLVFIRKAWYTTPILYYLRRDQYHLVG